MQNNMKIVEDNSICRGKLYWTAIPYSENRPLRVFSLIKNAKFLGRKKTENENTFSGTIDENGIRRSDEIHVISTYKRRLAIVVQNDSFNHDKAYRYVYVVPLTTFNSNDYKIEMYKNDDTIPTYHYVGSVGQKNKESVANTGDVKRIHKSLLLESTSFKALDSDVMEKICIKVSTILDIEKIAKCEQCEYNSIEKSGQVTG